MRRKLWDGIRVEVTRFGDAGFIHVHRIEMLGKKLTYEVSGGRPYDAAYNQAEMLAITIDAQFVVSGEIKRDSLSGKYEEFEDKETKWIIYVELGDVGKEF